MKKVGLIAALVAFLLIAASLVALAFLSRSSSHPFADPVNARCNTPSVTFGPAVVSPTHRELGVRFACVGAQLAGTLDVPPGRGPFPAVVWVHGAGESARLPYDGAPLIQALVDAGSPSSRTTSVGWASQRGSVARVTTASSTCWPQTWTAPWRRCARGRRSTRAGSACSEPARPAGSYRWQPFAPTGVWRSPPWWTRPQSPPERKTSTVKGQASRDHFSGWLRSYGPLADFALQARPASIRARTWSNSRRPGSGSTAVPTARSRLTRTSRFSMG